MRFCPTPLPNFTHLSTFPAMALRYPFPTLPGSVLHKPKLAFPADGLVTFGGFLSSFGVIGKPPISSLRCKAISDTQTQEYKDAIKNNLSFLQWNEKETKALEGESYIKVSESIKEKKQIDEIRAMLNSMGDGEISVSAYDTAWVALVKDIHGSGAPQFPSSLQWITENQLFDGSWGDAHIFSAHDRILNTLACVVALKAWDVCGEKCDKGMSFLRDNIGKLQDEDVEHMPIGFEVAFPSLLEIARTLDLDLPYDSPIFDDIYAKRNLKLKRIPKEVMHKVPTTLLHSLEGMLDLDWDKLLKLQCDDGSFLFSPSSTAFALMQTKDENCVTYLRKAVERFNGGVPNVYPVDLFEHIWAVDRLERLGISRYFKLEIKNCLDYVYRYWTEDGICWARNSSVHDVDDTSMAFRLLRLHGYEVFADVFRNFEKEGEFFCFVGQSNQAITGMYNLNRASQVMFPGEKILEMAKEFSFKFLREKQVANKLVDKWIITKALAGEVEYALEFPWYASLPRIETKFYIDQYGGEDDVWIGKTLYRMPFVNNNTYLELAKSDFNKCQSIHQLELEDIQKWYRESNLGRFGVTKKTVLKSYFMAAATVFEPEKALERLAWVRTQILMDAVSFYFTKVANTAEEREAFVNGFGERWKSEEMEKSNGLSGILAETLELLSLEALGMHGHNIYHRLRHAWETWLCWMCSPQKDNTSLSTKDVELLVNCINICAGHSLPQELLHHPHYTHLTRLTNQLSHHLSKIQKDEDSVNGNYWQASRPIDSGMQEFVQCVLQNSDGVTDSIKQTFLKVVKSIYYMAYCPPATVDLHIEKVLFERVA